MRGTCRLAVAVVLALAGAAAARADVPSVARARYGAEQGLARGTVFFLQSQSGPVVVGAAHSFEGAKLASAPEVVFELGRTRTRAADSQRLLTPLGAGLSDPGGSLRTDFVVFALDAPPAGVQVLSPASGRAKGRVQVLGIPAAVPGDQEAVSGDVEKASDDALEIELDAPHDVRGWGGAPVVDRDGHVVGIVQAARPQGQTMVVLATPIGVVTEALRLPLEGGRGRAFASLGGGAAPAAPEPVAAGPEAATGTAAAAPPAAPASPRKPPLIRQVGPQRPIALAVDQPADHAVLGGRDATAFVAGRALVPRAEGLTTDVFFVIDVSGSTAAPSGADVNGNGVVGTAPIGAQSGLYALGSGDPGDSVLAAEVAAVRRLMSRLDSRYTRVGLATFSGEMLDGGVIGEHPATTEMALTTRYEDVQRALDRVLARGPGGGTFMSAGVQLATRELRGERGAFSTGDPKSQKVIVFLTDGIPTLPFEGDDPRNTIAVVRAADEARKAGARVFSFGVGEEALAGPLALVEMSRVTDGTFTPVRDPAQLSDVFAEVEFADIAEIRVRNATIAAPAQVTELGADGSFASFVPLRPGRNAVEVTATSTDGRSATRTLQLEFAPDAAPVVIPEGLVSIQNRLLEMRLAQLRRDRVAGEQERADAVRDRLAREIEREREAATARAAQQRKKLEVKVERDDGTEPEPTP